MTTRTVLPRSDRPIEDLVASFQAGDREAGALLLQAFAPFLDKYERLLKFGSFSIRNKETRRFLSLFMQGQSRYRILRSRWSIGTILLAQQVADYVSYQARHVLDIRSELELALLEMAKSYRPMKAGFAGYLMGAFRYRVARAIKNAAKDPLTHRPGPLALDDAGAAALEQPVKELGLSWVIGQDVEWPFDRLTPLERYVLLQHVQEGESLLSLAHRTGYSRWSLWHKIKRRLESLVSYPGLKSGA